jgi:hypothetical protein
MRFTLALAVLTATLGMATPLDDTSSPMEVAVPMEEARDLHNEETYLLTKRACVSNGCRCVKGLRQGQYCGACQWRGNWVISAKRIANHLYECNPQGGCCSYGRASDCNTGSGRCGPY